MVRKYSSAPSFHLSSVLPLTLSCPSLNAQGLAFFPHFCRCVIFTDSHGNSILNIGYKMEFHAVSILLFLVQRRDCELPCRSTSNWLAPYFVDSCPVALLQCPFTPFPQHPRRWGVKSICFKAGTKALSAP